MRQAGGERRIGTPNRGTATSTRLLHRLLRSYVIRHTINSNSTNTTYQIAEFGRGILLECARRVRRYP
jgi:hypothetical protein